MNNTTGFDELLEKEIEKLQLTSDALYDGRATILEAYGMLQQAKKLRRSTRRHAICSIVISSIALIIVVVACVLSAWN